MTIFRLNCLQGTLRLKRKSATLTTLYITQSNWCDKVTLYQTQSNVAEWANDKETIQWTFLWLATIKYSNIVDGFLTRWTCTQTHARSHFFPFATALFIQLPLIFEYFNMLTEAGRWLTPPSSSKTVNSNRKWSYTIYFHCISIKRYSRSHFILSLSLSLTLLSNIYDSYMLWHMRVFCPVRTQKRA